MDFFKNIFTKNNQKNVAAEKKDFFDLKLGAFLEFDFFELEILQKAKKLGFELPDKNQKVEAIGLMELGQGSFIKRFYTLDNCYLQINYTNDSSVENIDEILLFIYQDSKAPSSNDIWQNWLEPKNIGAQKALFLEKEYTRVFYPEENNNVPAINASELIKNKSGQTYLLDNFFMLYSRDITKQKKELLLLNAEETNQDKLISRSLGVTLNQEQFQVIS